jgi:hypothetical protein
VANETVAVGGINFGEKASPTVELNVQTTRLGIAVAYEMIGAAIGN